MRKKNGSPRTQRTASGVTFDTETGEIIDVRSDRVAILPVRRRTVARRRLGYRLRALGPALIVLIVFIVLAILFNQPGNHCEPNLNC